MKTNVVVMLMLFLALAVSANAGILTLGNGISGASASSLIVFHDPSGTTFYADHTVDGSGMAAGIHSSAWGGVSWLDEYGHDNTGNPAGADGDAWISYEFDQAYDLSEISIWNYKEVWTRGLRDIQIHYKDTLGAWHYYLPPEVPAGQNAWLPPANWNAVDYGAVDRVYTLDVQQVTGLTITAGMSAGSGFASWGEDIMGLAEVPIDGVPEPATLALLCLGALVVRKRKPG